MAFKEFIFFVIGACVGYGAGFCARLGWWSALIALVTGILFVVGSIWIRLLLQKRR
jgi:hypothetical protein